MHEMGAKCRSSSAFSHLLELEELPILPIVEPALDGDAVVDLIPKRVGGVVDENLASKGSPQDVQVLQVVALDREARLPEHPVLDVPSLRVDPVEKAVGIDLLASGENDDLELFADCL